MHRVGVSTHSHLLLMLQRLAFHQGSLPTLSAIGSAFSAAPQQYVQPPQSPFHAQLQNGPLREHEPHGLLMPNARNHVHSSPLHAMPLHLRTVHPWRQLYAPRLLKSQGLAHHVWQPVQQGQHSPPSVLLQRFLYVRPTRHCVFPQFPNDDANH